MTLDPNPLIYWMMERQSIYREKMKGEPFPWTNDDILRKYRFCNVFREQDTTTMWIRKNYTDMMYGDNLVLTCAIARFFNLPKTLQAIPLTYIRNYNPEAIKAILEQRAKEGHKIFSPAYIISACGSTKPKIERVIDDYITPLHDAILSERYSVDPTSLENSWKGIRQFLGFGPFMSYEVITDLRHTHLLAGAKDIFTWANAGPGAIRGLNRLHGRPLKCRLRPDVYNIEMRELLTMAKRLLPKYDIQFKHLEMRDIEHSLCETDKYLRVLNGEGTPKELYKP